MVQYGHVVNNALLMVMLGHVFWTALLYLALTIVRAPKVWGLGAQADGSNPWAEIEPRVSANLSNQFEWPLFFHIACVIIMSGSASDSPVYVWLGCVFLTGRIAHSAVQILTSNIRLRGLVFTINFVSVLGMWCALGYSVFL